MIINYLLRRKNLNARIGSIVNFILSAILLMTAIAVFVPLSPAMPAANLDSSWSFGLNQAVAQGLAFGKEIIFTFGPYTSIYTRAYNPSTDFIMLLGSMCLALSYWACCALLIKGVKWYWILIFCFFGLAGLTYNRDVLFFSYPLLVGLVCFKNAYHNKTHSNKLAPYYFAILFASLGLLPLVKGNTLILCAAIEVLCLVFFIVNNQTRLALVSLLTSLISMLFFWSLSGQFVTNLPNYFINMAPVISGFTEAMAVNGSIREIILYLIASIFLLIVISIQKQINVVSKIFLLCIYFLFLFVSFKAGFVRHGSGHVVIAGGSIFIAALLLPFIFNSRIILPIIIFALLTWSYIYSNHRTKSFLGEIKSTYSSAWHGMINRINDQNWPKSAFDAKVDSIRKEAAFPILQGTTDIYSHNQSYLIASGNTWNPRPIFQSYSVYTPALAIENKMHLLGSRAPDNVIFKVEPIDNRIPSIEDGVSWPILLANYRPVNMVRDFLFLKKKDSVAEIAEPIKLTSENHTFGENVNLPQSDQQLFANIEIKPTVFGHLASIFFKTSQLRITLNMNNGSQKQYRIIANMAESGFLISPLIENTNEFKMLYDKKGLDEKRVKSLTIMPMNGKSRLWNNEYTVIFSALRNGY